MIIASSSLQHSVLIQDLISQGETIKFAPSLLVDLVLPKHELAVSLIDPLQWIIGNDAVLFEKIQDLIQRKKKLANRFPLFFVLVRIQDENIELFMKIQTFFLQCNESIPLIPFHNDKELLGTLGKLTRFFAPSSVEQFKTRFHLIQNQRNSLIDSPDELKKILSQLGAPLKTLSSYECSVLQEMQTIQDISTASVEDLMDCALDSETSQAIFEFFRNDFVS